MKVVSGSNFADLVPVLTVALSKAPVVHVGEWQAIRDDIPQADTIELEDVSLEVNIPEGVELWQKQTGCNLPWAEDHFNERVSGQPLNPPPSHEWWPYAQKSNEQHVDSNSRFSHTYPERFWPKWAGHTFTAMEGIRYVYGDLEDVVKLLRERPGTRQAYLPVWFPEDTGAVAGQRVPCTLGYHFLIRDGRLKIVYYIRSCDFYRHFRDDVYLAGRLAQWMSAKLGVDAGKLVMHISSLHIFAAEKGKIDAEAATIREEEASYV